MFPQQKRRKETVCNEGKLAQTILGLVCTAIEDIPSPEELLRRQVQMHMI